MSCGWLVGWVVGCFFDEPWRPVLVVWHPEGWARLGVGVNGRWCGVCGVCTVMWTGAGGREYVARICRLGGEVEKWANKSSSCINRAKTSSVVLCAAAAFAFIGSVIVGCCSPTFSVAPNPPPIQSPTTAVGKPPQRQHKIGATELGLLPASQWARVLVHGVALQEKSLAHFLKQRARRRHVCVLVWWRDGWLSFLLSFLLCFFLVLAFMSSSRPCSSFLPLSTHPPTPISLLLQLYVCSTKKREKNYCRFTGGIALPAAVPAGSPPPLEEGRAPPALDAGRRAV